MANFNHVYEKLYLECNEELEYLRQKAKQTLYKNILIGIIIMLEVYIFICCFMTQNRILIGTAFSFLLLTSVWWFENNKESNYNKIFKEKVIGNIVKSYGENLNYAPNAGISRSVYLEGEFEKFNRFRSEDDISGITKNGYTINMAEVHTESKNKLRNGRVTYTTLFHGLYAMVKIDKFLPNTIKIRKNTVKIFDSHQRIEMDSGEFEKIYDIYSDNKIIAMQIFTSDILQMFVDFADYGPELTIKNNKVFIRFETGNVFEGNIFKSSLDYTSLKRYYNIIGFCLHVSEIMHNNIKEI